MLVLWLYTGLPRNTARTGLCSGRHADNIYGPRTRSKEQCICRLVQRNIVIKSDNIFAWRYVFIQQIMYCSYKWVYYLLQCKTRNITINCFELNHKHFTGFDLMKLKEEKLKQKVRLNISENVFILIPCWILGRKITNDPGWTHTAVVNTTIMQSLPQQSPTSGKGVTGGTNIKSI